jgi:hypothetical protein
MNSREEKKIEAELKRVRPAGVPAPLMKRLMAARAALDLECKKDERKVEANFSQSQLAETEAGRTGDVHEPRPSWLQGFRRPRAAVYGGGIVSLWRWLVPAAALAVALAAAWWLHLPRASRNPSMETKSGLVKADDVQIDRELVSTFDAVAPMPGGEPVRFRFREWMDQVVLQDSARGVVIEERSPRVEVVSVRFETY